jgi:carboxylate-amine ligase
VTAAHAFGTSAPLSVGIEEELFVLDAETLEPAPAPPELFDRPRRKPELLAPMVELTTGIHDSVGDAAAELAVLRAEAAGAAAGAGLTVGAAGTWPLGVPEEQPVTPDRAYDWFVERGGTVARRQLCAGLHVHVGVESPDRCLAALESVLPWLPVILAASANSPWLAGRETGLASSRAEIVGLLPRTGAPPVFSSYAEFDRYAARLVELGLADTTERVWWDVRPHPRYGTIEIRMPDQPTSLEATAAFAELARRLVAAAEPGPPADRAVYAENRWIAARFGPAGELLHPARPDAGLVPAGELLAELVGRLGDDPLLAPLDGLDQAGAQLRGGRDAGLRGLCRQLTALTYDSARWPSAPRRST